MWGHFSTTQSTNLEAHTANDAIQRVSKLVIDGLFSAWVLALLLGSRSYSNNDTPSDKHYYNHQHLLISFENHEIKIPSNWWQVVHGNSLRILVRQHNLQAPDKFWAG